MNAECVHIRLLSFTPGSISREGEGVDRYQSLFLKSQWQGTERPHEEGRDALKRCLREAVEHIEMGMSFFPQAFVGGV